MPFEEYLADCFAFGQAAAGQKLVVYRLWNNGGADAKNEEVIKELFPNTSALKTLRKKRKLTQEQLAILSGVNIRTIRSYEQGTSELAKAQGETLLMLSKALNCSMEELLN